MALSDNLNQIIISSFLSIILITTSVVSAATIYVPDNYSTIQEAVDSSTEKDTIIVRDGIYKENVDIDKQLNIHSENGSENTTVKASDPKNHVFKLTADNVTVSGIHITGATKKNRAGVYMGGVQMCTISDIRFTNNSNGIKLDSSNNNTLSANTITNNSDAGIKLDSSGSNTLSANTITNNSDAGIKLDSSGSNTLSANTVTNNSDAGIKLDSSDNNTISANTVTNNSDAGIKLDSSGSNTISANTVTKNKYGIHLISSSNDNIFNSNIVLLNVDFDYYSDNNSHYNTVNDLTIDHRPTKISFVSNGKMGIKGVNTTPPIPSDILGIEKYVNVKSLGEGSFFILNISYDDANLESIDERTLSIWMYADDTWSILNNSKGVCTSEKYVFANITSAGELGIFGNSIQDSVDDESKECDIGNSVQDSADDESEECDISAWHKPMLDSTSTLLPTENTGEVTSEVKVTSKDGKASLSIPPGIFVLDNKDDSVLEVKIFSPPSLPMGIPSGTNYVGYIYNFKPSEVTFSEPVKMSIVFDTLDFEDRQPVIYVFESSQWGQLSTTIDWENNVAYTTTNKFGTFVLFSGDKTTVSQHGSSSTGGATIEFAQENPERSADTTEAISEEITDSSISGFWPKLKGFISSIFD